jgi:hypothetical protein
MQSNTTTANLADFQVALLEHIRQDPVKLYSKFMGLSQKIGGMKRVEKVNERAYKILQKKYAGGTLQKIDYDGGSLGVGSGPASVQMFGGIFYGTFGIELTSKLMSQTEVKGTGMTGGAAINAFAESVGEAMQTMVYHMDRYLFTSGNGVLTAPASATGTWSGGITYTFNGPTDFVNCNWLKEGMAVHIWDTNLATPKPQASPRTGYPFIIDSIDWASRTVSLIGTPSVAAASTDRLTVVGLAGNGGPATPSTFTSGYPLTPASGDSWIHGIPYAHDDTGANYFLGVQKSTRPQLLPQKVDAASAFWTPFMTQDLRDKFIESCGPDALNGLFGIVHMVQRKQASMAGTAITNFPKTSQTGIVDMSATTGPDGLQEFEWGDINHIILPQQPRNRIDYMNLANWEQVYDFEGPRPIMNGSQAFFRIIDTTTGGQTTRLQWMWEFSKDFVCVDPWREGFIKNLGVPTVS